MDSQVLSVLNNFKEKLVNPEHAIKYVFVPEPVMDELRASGTHPSALLNYENAKAILPKNAFKLFMLMNVVSDMSIEDTDSIIRNVPMSEKITPLLGEALDIRQLWLSQSSEYEDLFNQLFALSESTEYPINLFKYDVENMLKNVLQGINNRVDAFTSMYESITTDSRGKYFFITMPYSSVESEPSDDTLEIFVKGTQEMVLRKSTIYHPEKTIAKTRVFGNYLLSLL